MTTLSDLLEIIKGILRFPDAVLGFIRLLEKTPQERHEVLLKKISDDRAHFEETGRPTWD